MADIAASYTYIGETSWWKVREQFKRRMPSSVDLSYITSLLNMKEGSARSNVLNPLKKIGILDENGVPTDRANDWRDDEKYPTVCQSILEECYPESVRDIYHDASQDTDKLASWFMNTNRLGKSAAYKYANFYFLLLRADPSEQTAKLRTATNQPKKVAKPTSSKKAVTPSEGESTFQKTGSSIDTKIGDEEQGNPGKFSDLSRLPQLHINIQLHISPESTPEQIDKIFESMAKHLKSFSEKGV